MKTSFLSEIKTAINIALFKHTDMHHVAGDKSKTKYAFYIICVGALLTFLSYVFFMSFITIGTALIIGVKQVIMFIIGIYLMSLIAQKVFKGHGTHDAFFRVAAYASILGWLSALSPILMGSFGLFGGFGLIGLLGLVLGVWGLILTYVILKLVHKVTTGGAIGTIVIMIVIGMIIGTFFGGSGKMYGGRFMDKTYKFNTPGGEAVMDIEDENNFKMDIDTDEGPGRVKMEEGKVTIEGPGGQKMEFEIPHME